MPSRTNAPGSCRTAVNYGAAVDDDNGLQFALYGLTGGYPGTYSVMPYHQLVRKYSDYENRDIWEYQLNLTATEVRRLLEHLWELQSNYADYYFFDENCSYQLLFLLDVARPGLALTDRFEVYAIPVDTVRAVVDQPGLLGGTVFRASSRTRIEQRLRTLDPPERTLVNRLADGELAPDATELQALPAPRRAAVLELAADFVTYRLRTGEQARDQAAALAWRLLAARSQVAAAAAAAGGARAGGAARSGPRIGACGARHRRARRSAVPVAAPAPGLSPARGPRGRLPSRARKSISSISSCAATRATLRRSSTR